MFDFAVPLSAGLVDVVCCFSGEYVFCEENMCVYFCFCVCCVPFWNMCHSETCFRLAWCVILKNVHFWNMFQISTVQTSSYRSRMINAWSWSIKISEKRPKVRPGCICLFVCLFVCLFFSNKSRATSNVMVKKDILSSALDMTKFARCQSETCFRNAHFSKRHTMPIWNMFQDGSCFRTARNVWLQCNVFEHFPKFWVCLLGTVAVLRSWNIPLPAPATLVAKIHCWMWCLGDGKKKQKKQKLFMDATNPNYPFWEFVCLFCFVFFFAKIFEN